MNLYLDIGISFFDFLITIVLFWAIYRGYKRGSIVHSISLLMLLAGLAISSRISYSIYGYVQDKARVPLYNLPVILFSFLAILSAYGSHFITYKVTANVGEKPKGVTNRILGIFVNVVKYLYLMSVVLIIIFKLDANFDFIQDVEKKRTRLFYPVLSVAPRTFHLLSFREIHPVPIGKPIEIKRQQEINDELDTFDDL